MGFKVAGYSFVGSYPVDEADDIKDLPGLYAILCRRNKKHYLVDVGESDKLKSELEANGRRELWEQNCSGALFVSVKYTTEMQKRDRKKIEKKIRRRHNPPCRRTGEPEPE